MIRLDGISNTIKGIYVTHISLSTADIAALRNNTHSTPC